jgi:uroporphyrinogen-III decarboxylase
MMVRVYSGVETIAYLWADHRAELHQLFAVMEEKYRQQFELYASLGFDLLYCTDDTSTSTISPAMFEEFCMGFTDRMADTVHRFGVQYVHHSCGLVNNLLDLYRQTRMDAVDALCLKPIGDVDSLAVAKAKLGPRISIIAPLIQICGDMSNRDAVAESIAKMFRDVASGDNICFAIGSEPTQEVEAHVFFAKECRKHQRMYSQTSVPGMSGRAQPAGRAKRNR